MEGGWGLEGGWVQVLKRLKIKGPHFFFLHFN